MASTCNGRESSARIRTDGNNANGQRELIMKTKLFRFLFLTITGVLALAAMPAQAAGKVKVVTTLTDLADLTRNIGGEHVDVFSLATGVEDTHGVPMKPSFVPRMN